MGLISTIKSVLGIDDSGERRADQSGGTEVTVEREPDPSSERAVKESDDAATGETADANAGSVGGRTASGGDDPGTVTEADAGGTDDSTEDDGDSADESAESGDGGTEDGGDDGVPVDDIKGIGPAYADRLADADIDTVSDLAGADATVLAEATEIGENRLQGWIDRANAR